jgi:aminopeptidase N
VLADFYKRWQDDVGVVDKWFSIQASADRSTTFDEVKALTAHPAFQIKNPNRVRALIGAFCANLYHFHRSDGAGYAFLADYILMLNRLNPQIASRLTEPLIRWQRFAMPQKDLMHAALVRIQDEQGLSPDVYEIVLKSLSYTL